MRKILQFGFSMIALLALSHGAFSQITMPAAISIDPPDATGWDEITLTLDANKACTGASSSSIIGQSDIRMHSAAFLIDRIEDWQNKEGWGDPGIDFDAQPLEEGFDFPSLTDLGEGIYSITFTPGIFYGVPEGSTIIGITAVFNAGGGWNFEAKDCPPDADFGDFYIPLTYVDPSPALLFTLDLTYQEELGNFDSDGGEAFVIVNESEYAMEQLYEGIFPVARYEKLLTEADDGITAETEYSYKFKMDDTEETKERDPIVAGNFQTSRTHFFNDEEKPVLAADIKFIVDMRYAARVDTFSVESDYVDIAGTLMGWDESGENHLTDENNDTIYEITFEEVELGTKVEYKYRINGLWATSEFPGGGPNRHATSIEAGRVAKSVYNNAIPGYVPVIMSVNMSNEIANGTFVPAMDFVDVAGSMNGWGDGNWNDELVASQDGIYVTNPPAFAPVGAEGDTMQYKYRINSNWETSEFPGGGPNRKYVVLDTIGEVVNAPEVVWYNDVTLGIDDQPIRFQEVSFFPNPVSDVMYIENKVYMQEIRISNILGQQVVRMRLDNVQSYQLNTSELENGLYILSVFGEQGYVGTAKFIKQ